MRRSHAPSVLLAKQQANRQVSPPLQPVVENGSTVDRMFQVLYGRISTKTTQKTFEKDGTLFLTDNNLILRDEGGFLETSMPYMRSIRLDDGFEFIMEPKEVKIIREIGGKVSKRPTIKTEAVEEEREFQPPRQIVFQRQESASVNRVIIKQEVPEEEEEISLPTNNDEIVQQSQAVPLDKEELIICCRASKRQILAFQGVYRESAENQEEELWEICNRIADQTNGKLEVMKGIVVGALEQNESVLIAAADERVLNDLYDFGMNNFRGSCEILINSRDVQETAKNIGCRAVFASSSLLGPLKESGMTIHRSIIYEKVPSERNIERLSELTLGPVYHLIICGSIEERCLQIKHNLLPGDSTEDEFMTRPGDFSTSNTHKLLDCDCLEDQVLVKRSRTEITQDQLKDWQHIPGGEDLKEEHVQLLNISREFASSIVFIFKRRFSMRPL